MNEERANTTKRTNKSKIIILNAKYYVTIISLNIKMKFWNLQNQSLSNKNAQELIILLYRPHVFPD